MTIDEAIERLQAIKDAHPDLDLELWCLDSFGEEVEAKEFEADRFSGRVSVLWVRDGISSLLSHRDG